MLPLLAGALVLSGAYAGPRAAAPVPQRHLVTIRGMAFQPAALSVQPGDTIVWVNEDIVPHTATALQPLTWTTGTLLGGQRGEYVAQGHGVVDYTCVFHPTMKGRLTIQ